MLNVKSVLLLMVTIKNESSFPATAPASVTSSKLFEHPA